MTFLLIIKLLVERRNSYIYIILSLFLPPGNLSLFTHHHIDPQINTITYFLCSKYTTHMIAPICNLLHRDTVPNLPSTGCAEDFHHPQAPSAHKYSTALRPILNRSCLQIKTTNIFCW